MYHLLFLKKDTRLNFKILIVAIMRVFIFLIFFIYFFFWPLEAEINFIFRLLCCFPLTVNNYCSTLNIMIDRLLNTSELATSQIQEITSFHTNILSKSIFLKLFSKWVNLYFYLIINIESKSSHLRYCLIFSSLNIMM